MTALLMLPAVLALLTLAAHVLRLGNLVWTLELVVLTLLLLALRRRWVLRLTQLVLLVGTVEWVRTLRADAAERIASGLPYQRLVFILGGTALVTALAALLLQTRRMRARYRPADPPGPPLAASGPAA